MRMLLKYHFFHWDTNYYFTDLRAACKGSQDGQLPQNIDFEPISHYRLQRIRFFFHENKLDDSKNYTEKFGRQTVVLQCTAFEFSNATAAGFTHYIKYYTNQLDQV